MKINFPQVPYCGMRSLDARTLEEATCSSKRSQIVFLFFKVNLGLINYTALYFIHSLFIALFASVSYASSCGASLLPIIRDLEPRVSTTPLSESTISQKLAQNQRTDSNQDTSPLSNNLLDSISPKTEPEEEEPFLSELNERTIPNRQNILVEKIEVIGSSFFGREDATITLEELIEEIRGHTVSSEKPIKILEEQIEAIEGRTVTSEKLTNVANKIADSITQVYLNEGFLTSRAKLDSVKDGILLIEVIEGELEKIEIEGLRRLNRSYISSQVKLGAGKPLNIAKLEDQLRLLRANPLFENVEASLKEGAEKGKSILVVRVTEAEPFEGNFGIDNYSPPSVGAVRLNLNLLYRNLTGIGDEISAFYSPRIETIDGTYQLEFAYQAPLNPMEGTLQLKTLIDRNEVVEGEFEDSDIRGEAEQYQINFRQPLILNPRQELALSLGFVYRDGRTFAFGNPFPFGIGPDEDGISRTSVFELGQEYTLRDVSGAWAFRSQLRFGTDIFDATENPSSDPDGQFFSWLAQVQRVQVLNDDNFLIIQGDLQLTPDSLLPSEQFVIGGGQSVRGYRQNVRAGDNGFRFSIEDRITVTRNEGGESVFIVAPFFDMGSVWNVSDNPNPQFSQRFIAGLGLGLLWEPIKGLNMRVDYAPPLIDLDDRGNNVQDDGLNFSLNYQF